MINVDTVQKKVIGITRYIDLRFYRQHYSSLQYKTMNIRFGKAHAMQV
jgi:hypothetical protein